MDDKQVLDDFIQRENEERDRLKELYQKDLVGVLSELYAYVGLDIQEQEKDKSILEAEKNGFRRGFQIALRLCMEGMTGGVVS